MIRLTHQRASLIHDCLMDQGLSVTSTSILLRLPIAMVRNVARKLRVVPSTLHIYRLTPGVNSTIWVSAARDWLQTIGWGWCSRCHLAIPIHRIPPDHGARHGRRCLDCTGDLSRDQYERHHPGARRNKSVRCPEPLPASDLQRKYPKEFRK